MAIVAHAPAAGAGFFRGLRAPVLALSLAALFWAGSFVVGRALREAVDPVALTFWRWFISLLIFAPFVGRELVSKLPAIAREWRLILGLGATGIALFHPLVYLALQHTSATNALVTLSLAPALIVAGASVTGGGRLSAPQIAGMLVSMAGAAVVITRGNLATVWSAGFNVGDLWMLAAVAVWAAYSLLLRRRPAHLSQTLTLVASIAAALPILLMFMLLMPSAGPALALSPPVLLGTGYVAVFGSVLGFLFWSHGVAELGPGRAGQFVHLMPLFGAALAFTFLGEPLAMPQVLGAVLVVSGLVVIERHALA